MSNVAAAKKAAAILFRKIDTDDAPFTD